MKIVLFELSILLESKKNKICLNFLRENNCLIQVSCSELSSKFQARKFISDFAVSVNCQ